jgi:hypothetical protein
MLTDRELEDIRADVLDLLDDTCDVLRRIEVTVGGFTEYTFGTVHTDVPCRLDPRTLQDTNIQLLAGREVMRSVLTLNIPPTYDLEPGDRILHSGEYYEVVIEYEQHTERAVTRVTLVRLENIDGD